MRTFGLRLLGPLAACLVAPHALAAPPESALAGSQTGGAGVAISLNPVTKAVAARFGATARVRLDASGRFVRQIFGLAVATQGNTPSERALAFAAANADLLAPGAAFVVTDIKSPRLQGARGPVTRDIVRLGHTVGGYTLEGRVSTVTLDGAGQVIAVATDGAPIAAPTAKPALTAAGASKRVEDLFRVRALTDNATLVALPAGDEPSARLAWKVPAVAVALVAHFFVWVDAESGAILKHGPVGPDQGLLSIPSRDAR